MSTDSFPCAFCDTDLPQQEKLVTLTMTRDGRWYIFENVPARVCPNCGHKYFDGPMILRLEQMIDEKPDEARPVEAWAFSLPSPDLGSS
jgi:YgiT-type zinc finger domain-containing protein